MVTIGDAPAQDSVKAPASIRYMRPNLGEQVFVGDNYRVIWSLPVRVKVFRLDQEKGGLKITELGGGMQTKSLKLEDKSGRKWVLRTVDKTVDKAMEAEGIKSGLAKNVTQDMISAAQPYGALTVPPMAKALGVVSTRPELVYVTDDLQFGEHRSLFANTMCLLEELEPVLFPGDKVVKTDKMLKDLAGHPEYRLDRKQLLQARLLDMLIGDWDRLAGQWRWGYHRQGSGVSIYPIPVDHDQAYFNSTGALVPMVRPFTMKHIVGYRDNTNGLKTLNRKEWDFDRSLLGDLSEEDWRSGILTFQARLTDAVLAEGVSRLPKELLGDYGPKLLQQLKGRRNTLLTNGMKYYHFLQSREPREITIKP
jgi:hypothetical protein